MDCSTCCASAADEAPDLSEAMTRAAEDDDHRDAIQRSLRLHLQQVKLQELPESCETPKEPPETCESPGKMRSRSESWRQLPQSSRGVSLEEIWEFHNSDGKWLQTLRWQCKECGRPGEDQAAPQKACSYCKCAEGESQLPNLYEVNERMIMPRCREHQVSYVEFLRFFGHDQVAGAKQQQGREVNTFVSHWWGEEFHYFVKTLHRFTRSHCSSWKFKDHAFWICAFCNNQFHVEHALGYDGDVTTSSFATALRAPSCMTVLAVLDKNGTIYNRIWCAFELFYVAKIMPRRCNKDVQILLGNEKGLVSLGDGSWRDVEKMNELVAHVKTSGARASVDADKEMIQQLMANENTTHAELDSILKHLATKGIFKCQQRQKCVLALLLGSCVPALSVDAAVILGHVASGSVDGSSWIVSLLRCLIFMSLASCLLVVLIVVRGLPRAACRKDYEDFMHHVCSPRRVLVLACCIFSTNDNSLLERHIERRLWLVSLLLSLLPLAVTLSMVISGQQSGVEPTDFDSYSLMVMAVITLLGLLYQGLRPYNWFKPFRRWVEDRLFPSQAAAKW
eukprot:TRINITY_DN19092_c0_g1_i1.p1 TRINITY_DN19092_c0_g1~~TRINITY_DN19092_c0_g1_i1.p1  ORF type:complete len:564 (+),score=112.45 TRINITY_DN19092_c0_g1_i1:32-1723(+)